MNEPRLFVISGNQGAGKTTVAGLLARRFARGVHIEVDALRRMVVAGVEWPKPPEPSGEALRQLELGLHNGCLIAKSFIDAGFTVVLDHILIGAHVNRLAGELAGHECVFIMLTPDARAIAAHEQERGTALYTTWGGILDEAIQNGTPRFGLWLDNSAQTPEETVDEILRRASEGVVSFPLPSQGAETP